MNGILGMTDELVLDTAPTTSNATTCSVKSSAESLTIINDILIFRRSKPASSSSSASSFRCCVR